MIYYTTQQLAAIITGSTSVCDLQLVQDYCFENAVQIITTHGKDYYKTLVFSVKEKFRSLEKISA